MGTLTLRTVGLCRMRPPSHASSTSAALSLHCRNRLLAAPPAQARTLTLRTVGLCRMRLPRRMRRSLQRRCHYTVVTASSPPLPPRLGSLLLRLPSRAAPGAAG